MVNFNIWHDCLNMKNIPLPVHHQLKQLFVCSSISGICERNDAELKLWFRIVNKIMTLVLSVVINDKLIIVINLHCTVQYRLVLRLDIRHRLSIVDKISIKYCNGLFGIPIIYMLTEPLAYWYQVKPLQNISMT